MNNLPNPTTELHPRLKLIKFTWDKRDVRDEIEFSPGFNLLGDRSQAERTMILRLMRYAMGGTFSRIPDDVIQQTKLVQIEFMANDKKVVTTRGFETPTGKFSVILNDKEELSLNPLEMARRLLTWLDIPTVYYQRAETKVLLSFNDIARTFVIDRDFGYNDFLPEMYSEPRKEAIKLMLGLTTQEIADAEEAVRHANAEVERLKTELKGISRLLVDFSVGSLLEIEQRRANLEQELKNIDMEDATLRKTIETASNNSTDSYTSVQYRTFQDELIHLRDEMRDVDSEISVLEKQISEKSDLKVILEGEAAKLERRVSTSYVLSTFTFSKCPRCLQLIDTDMRAREVEGRCMLCDRPFQHEDGMSATDWDKALADAKKLVEEAAELLNYYQRRMKSLQNRRNDGYKRVARIDSELARQTAAYVSPAIEDLSLINARRSEIVGAISKVELEQQQRDYLNKLHDETLPALTTMLEETQEQLRVLQHRRGRQSERIEALLTHFRNFMRATATNRFIGATWDDKELLPLINEQTVTKAMTGFDLAISVLAFHYSLLAMRSIAPVVDTAHPGLLMVDEPNQQQMSHEAYSKIMHQLLSLGNAQPDHVQILVAATDIVGFENYSVPIRSTKVL